MINTQNKDRGELLLEEKLISREQLDKALEMIKVSGESMEKTLLNLGYITEKELTMFMGKEMGVPFIDLEEVEIDEELTRAIPEHLAQRYKVIPVKQKTKNTLIITGETLIKLPDEISIDNLKKLINKEFSEKDLKDKLEELNFTEKEIETIINNALKIRGNNLVLAMVDPLNVFAIDDIRLITSFDIEPVIATEKSIMDSLNRIFPTWCPPAPLPWYKKAAVTEGTMAVTNMENTVLPLKYTEVKADITGMLADVKVTQKFQNELSENIEAVYMFPLSSGSAVQEFEIVIGERVIKSVVKEKKEARRTYEKAKQAGKKAGLLEQERPDIFTVSVANIEPGQDILVNIRYYETIKYEDTDYEFVFPMAITPRYAGKDSKGVPESLEGKISPPILPPAKDAGREVKIFINLDAGFPTGDISSPTHSISVKEKEGGKKEIEFAREKEIPNKDFVLKYSSTGEKVETALAFYREEGKAGTFMLHLTPKMDYGPEEMVKREMIFVLDRSGSMGGEPIKQAKSALKDCLRTLRGGDFFSIITFDDTLECFSEKSLEFNEENLEKADRFIDSIDARGGTEILSALKKAFQIPETKDCLRQIVFLTDGAVWGEEESLREINKNLGKSRVFTFGIGPCVNRYFLSKLADLGRGTCHFITDVRQIKEEIEAFSKQVSCPILSDLALDMEDANIFDIYPDPVPDLYFGQVICLLGRFHSSGKVKGRLTGRTGLGNFEEEFTVELPEKENTHPVIETIWARKHIDVLLDLQRREPQKKAEIRDEIIGIGLKYHLMSPYTSLVAVEEVEEEKEKEKKKEKKELIKIDVPQILPEGLEHNAFTAPLPYGYTELGEVHETVQDIAMCDFGDIEEEIELDKLKEIVDEAPIIRVTNLIISQAINDGADEIHIEPQARNLCVRYRIDGLLQEVMAPPKHIESPLIRRIKDMANMDVSEKALPQEGKIHISHDGKEYEAKVTTLPTIQGEKIFMSLRCKELELLGPDKLGLTSSGRSLFEGLMSEPHGLIVFAGPPESGKTTTLYNGLNMLIGSNKRICIIEESVEYQLEGIKDINVEQRDKQSVKGVLGDIVHKTYDTIMIGELKEKEVALVALKAAIAKHLVLSTLEADDTLDVITRLTGMGIETSILSEGLTGIIAQRLVRKICPHCRESYIPAKEALEMLGADFTAPDMTFYRGRGCDMCKNTGYHDMVGIYEIMAVNDNIRSLICRNSPSIVIKDAALESGMITLRKDCLSKILEGTTTIEEYFRVFNRNSVVQTIM